MTPAAPATLLVVTACSATGLACVAPFACQWGPITGLLELWLMMLGWFLCERGPVVGSLIFLPPWTTVWGILLCC